MQQEPIADVDRVAARIPASWRPWFSITVCEPIAPHQEPVLDAFGIAVELVYSKIQNPHRIHIIFGTSPFRVRLNNGTVLFNANDEVINWSFDNLILLDIVKMSKLHHNFQVSCIVEELVHASIRVSDETTVTNIVGILYDGIRVINGKYHLP